MTAFAAGLVRRRLRRLAEVVAMVGVENTAHYFLLGDPMEEPRFIRSVVRDRHSVLLLDLHNVYTMATNMSFDPLRYLEKLPLGKVIEIHVSGGSWSEAEWLRSKKCQWLDSHDSAVPDEVWRLLRFVRPRCPNLEGVTLERMEGTVTPRDVPRLRHELRRLKREVS